MAKKDSDRIKRIKDKKYKAEDPTTHTLTMEEVNIKLKDYKEAIKVKLNKKK